MIRLNLPHFSTVSGIALVENSLEKRRFAPRLSVFYAALFLSIGIYMPFFPVWLAARGFAPEQISVLLAVPMAVRIVITRSAGRLADRHPNRRGPILVATAAAALGFAVVGLVSGFTATLAAMSLMAVFWTSILPLTEAFALQGMRLFGADYGRMRLWGSASFILANFAAGSALDLWPSDVVFWLILSAMGLAIGAAWRLPVVPRQRKTASLAGEQSEEAGLSPRLFVAVLSAVAAMQASHALIYGFGSLHWQSLGYSGRLIGVLWALGVIAEITLFAVSGRIAGRLPPLGWIAVGAGAGVLRWLVLASDPALPVLVVAQLLHGFTFGATHLGTVRFIAATVPDERTASAQGLFFTLSGVAMAAATLASGPLYRHFGGEAFLAMALVAALAGGVLWAAYRQIGRI